MKTVFVLVIVPLLVSAQNDEITEEATKIYVKYLSNYVPPNEHPVDVPGNLREESADLKITPDDAEFFTVESIASPSPYFELQHELKTTTKTETTDFTMVPDSFIETELIRKYPFIAAVLSEDYEYVCTATIVSKNMFLTSSLCLEYPIKYIHIRTSSISKVRNSSYDYTNSKKVLTIIKSLPHPESWPGSNIRVAMLYTKPSEGPRIKISLTGHMYSHENVEYKAFGFGLDEDDAAERHLQNVKLYNFQSVSNTRSNGPKCFNDFGGPVVTDYELSGIVTKGIGGCIKDISDGRLVEVARTHDFRLWGEILISYNDQKYNHKNRYLTNYDNFRPRNKIQFEKLSLSFADRFKATTELAIMALILLRV